RRARAVHLLGHVHGCKGGNQLGQFADQVLGYYDVRTAAGQVHTTALRNNLHFDGVFADPFASDAVHVANLHWTRQFATLNSAHVNALRPPLPDRAVATMTFRAAPGENWGLLVAAATLEVDDAPAESTLWIAASQPSCEPSIAWPDVPRAFVQDAHSVKIFAPV